MLRTHPSLVALSLLVEPGMNSTALSVKGFEVSVKINNQLTPVYQPKSDAKGATATGYIASEEGATFSVHFKDVTPSPGRTHPLSCRVFIDGTKMGSQLLLEGDMETSFNGKQMSDVSLISLSFSPSSLLPLRPLLWLTLCSVSCNTCRHLALLFSSRLLRLPMRKIAQLRTNNLLNQSAPS